MAFFGVRRSARRRQARRRFVVASVFVGAGLIPARRRKASFRFLELRSVHGFSRAISAPLRALPLTGTSRSVIRPALRHEGSRYAAGLPAAGRDLLLVLHLPPTATYSHPTIGFSHPTPQLSLRRQFVSESLPKFATLPTPKQSPPIPKTEKFHTVCRKRNASGDRWP